MKLPKIPRIVWIVGGIAAGAYLISRKFGSASSGNFLKDLLGEGTQTSKGPQIGPGLYSSWNAGIRCWSVFDGEMTAEQVRFMRLDASGFSVTLEGDQIVVLHPDGFSERWPRSRNPTNQTPHTIW